MKKPMQSTGGQNFSVYIYYKTNEEETEPSFSELDEDESADKKK